MGPYLSFANADGDAEPPGFVTKEKPPRGTNGRAKARGGLSWGRLSLSSVGGKAQLSGSASAPVRSSRTVARMTAMAETTVVTVVTSSDT